MDISVFLGAISSVGFPIVCCGFLGFYIYKMQAKTNDIIQENTKVLGDLTNLVKGLIHELDETKKRGE